MEANQNQSAHSNNDQLLEDRLAALEQTFSLLAQRFEESQRQEDSTRQPEDRVGELEDQVKQLQTQLSAEAVRRKALQLDNDRLRRELQTAKATLAEENSGISFYTDHAEQRELLQRREEGLAFYLSRLNCTKF